MRINSTNIHSVNPDGTIVVFDRGVMRVLRSVHSLNHLKSVSDVPTGRTPQTKVFKAPRSVVGEQQFLFHQPDVLAASGFIIERLEINAVDSAVDSCIFDQDVIELFLSVSLTGAQPEDFHVVIQHGEDEVVIPVVTVNTAEDSLEFDALDFPGLFFVTTPPSPRIIRVTYNGTTAVIPFTSYEQIADGGFSIFRYRPQTSVFGTRPDVVTVTGILGKEYRFEDNGLSFDGFVKDLKNPGLGYVPVDGQLLGEDAIEEPFYWDIVTRLYVEPSPYNYLTDDMSLAFLAQSDRTDLGLGVVNWDFDNVTIGLGDPANNPLFYHDSASPALLPSVVNQVGEPAEFTCGETVIERAGDTRIDTMRLQFDLTMTGIQHLFSVTIGAHPDTSNDSTMGFAGGVYHHHYALAFPSVRHTRRAELWKHIHKYYFEDRALYQLDYPKLLIQEGLTGSSTTFNMTGVTMPLSVLPNTLSTTQGWTIGFTARAFERSYKAYAADTGEIPAGDPPVATFCSIAISNLLWLYPDGSTAPVMHGISPAQVSNISFSGNSVGNQETNLGFIFQNMRI